MTADNLRPIVVIGAARSGTKIIRDSLAAAMAAGVVPYDVGYVWRYGNESHPDDCLTVGQVKPRTRRLVRSFLERYADRQGVVIEKTVGNALRVPFVAEVLPEAVFVHVVRDGVDVAESARREWQAAPDLAYLGGKARHFPLRLAPTYGRKFVVSTTVGRWQASRRVGGRQASTWGPRYPGIDRDLTENGLLTVTARQWCQSVQLASRDLARVRQQVVTIRYEELTEDPALILRQVMEEIGTPVTGRRLEAAASTITNGSRGKGRSRLEATERYLLKAEIGNLLEDLGYDAP